MKCDLSPALDFVLLEYRLYMKGVLSPTLDCDLVLIALIADGFWFSPSITEMDYGGEYIKYYNNLLVSVSIVQSFLICILDIET